MIIENTLQKGIILKLVKTKLLRGYAEIQQQIIQAPPFCAIPNYFKVISKSKIKESDVNGKGDYC